MAAGCAQGSVGLKMKQVLAGLDPKVYVQHALHASERDWPETNCYTDLWIEVLHARGQAPEAMLGFTVAQDFEGDQFTFFKPSLEDIERLYGVRVTELSIFDDVERHVLTQIGRGRITLVEVDSYYLPDTRGVTYRQSHSKTTIAINGLDAAARRMTYFHNAGFYALEGEDYDGVFGRAEAANLLFPYVEFAKFPARAVQPSVAMAQAMLGQNLHRRPEANPFRAWQAELPAHVEDLLQRPEAYFHTYAFNTLRQFGANYALLGAHLDWLSASGLKVEIEACALISSAAKAMQFQLARAVARRKAQGLDAALAPISDAWDLLMMRLHARFLSRAA